MDTARYASLVNDLSNADPAIRGEALSELGYSARQEAAGPLIAMPKDPEKGVRDSVVRAPGELGPDGRWYAAHALGLVRPTSQATVRKLAGALNDPGPWVRHWVCLALAWIGPRARSALPSLTAALGDPGPFVRQQAAEAIRAIRGGDHEAAREETGGVP